MTMTFLWSTDLVGFHRALHPAPTLTPLGRITDGQWRELGSVVQPKRLSTGTNPPADFYWSVLGYAPVAPPEPKSTDIPWLLTTTRSTGRPVDLTAVWVDIDIRSGPYVQPDGLTDYERLVPAAISHALTRGLPPPSMLLQSGRGLWLLWVLRDPDDLPPALTQHTKTLHRAVQKALYATFMEWGADSKSIDAARTCRIPGTRNSHTGHLVSWARYSSATYDLVDLANALDVSPVAPRVQRPPSPADVVFGVRVAKPQARGSAESYRKRLEDLLRLAQMRGGYRLGHRGNAVMYMALIAHRRNKRDEADTLAQTLAFNAEHCTPALEESQVRATVASLVRNWREHDHLSYESMAYGLGVTPDERALGIFEAEAPTFPPERRGLRTAARENLYGELRQLRQELGRWPAIREAERLLAERGVVHPGTEKPYDRKPIRKALDSLGSDGEPAGVGGPELL